MTTGSVLVALATAAALAACGAAPEQGRQASAGTIASPGANTGAKAKERQDSAALPFVAGLDGTRYPYFEYGSSSPESEDALAVFVHPILERRDAGLALPHPRSQGVKELFETDELLGRQFSVASKGQTLLIDELPVSRPVDLKADSTWAMPYAGATFDCRVVSRTGIDFLIRCASRDTEFKLTFNANRGFTSYQDFCRKQTCTYTLESSVGLLSPYHLETVFPDIQRSK